MPDSTPRVTSSKPGLFGLLAATVLANRRLTVGLVALIVALCAALGLPPDVDGNLLALLPPTEPEVIALKQLHEEEGGVNLVTLSFGADDPALLAAYLPSLAARLGAVDGVAWAAHDIDPEVATRLGLLQLQAADVDELSVRLRGALALGPALNPFVSQRLMAMGAVTERIQSASEAKFIEAPEGQGRVLLRPTGSAHDRAFAGPFLGRLEVALDAAAVEEPGVKLLWLGGAYRHNVEDLRGIQADMLWTSIASFVLVFGCIVLAFRSVRATAIIFVPLVAANLVNLGLVRVFLGPLNTYTSFGTAILIGLGIDFAVHLVLRYREERAAGGTPESAVIRAWDKVGPPCMTAALTSAGGFLALSAADFQGFSQLGVLLAMGLLVCLLAMLTLLPLLLVTLDHDPASTGANKRASRVDPRDGYHIAPFALMVIVIATGIAGVKLVPKLDWEYDFSELRRDGLAYSELSDVERSLARESYSPVIVSYPDAASLSAGQRRWSQRLADGQLPHVARIISVASVLPDDQDRRIAALRSVQDQLGHANMRYLPPPFVKQLLPLRDAVLAPMTREQLPEPIRDTLGARSPDRHRLLVIPKGNMWDLREAAAFGDELREHAQGRTYAGEYPTLGALYRVTMRDMPRVGALALLMVTLLALIDLRRMHWAGGAIGTLIAGMVWAGAMLQLAGVKLSVINIVGVPILLGIGVDVIIHLLHRLREEGPGGVGRALRTTGVAASISTLTTILSFLSLTVAGNRGVRSLGLLVVIGLMAVFLSGATILPLAWAAGWRVTGRAPLRRAGTGSHDDKR